jgi:hypothetical protein
LMMNVCKKVVLKEEEVDCCDAAEWLFCDDGKILLGRGPLVGEMYKQCTESAPRGWCPWSPWQDGKRAD